MRQRGRLVGGRAVGAPQGTARHHGDAPCHGVLHGDEVREATFAWAPSDRLEAIADHDHGGARVDGSLERLGHLLAAQLVRLGQRETAARIPGQMPTIP